MSSHVDFECHHRQITLAIREICRVLAFVLAYHWSGHAVAADADDVEEPVSALKAVNNIEWSSMIVKIVDPDGKPIEGAFIKPWALRAGNAHGSWLEEAYGAPRRTKTDAAGQTDVVFPKRSVWRDTPQVVQVSMFVSHTDFCTKNVHVDVPQGNPPDHPVVALERGVRLRIAGVEPGSDKPLPDCHILLEGSETSDPEFTTEPDGWMKSIPIKETRRWFRVVRTPPGEPPQFSRAMAWAPDDPSTREVRAEVKPGVRVTGKISENVPRPITRGRVVAWCGSPQRKAPDAGAGRAESIWWIDTVPIQEDGAFEFSSLPQGYLAQIYAFANDSISAQPTDDAHKICCDWFESPDHERQRNHFFRYGQVLRLVGAKSQFTVEMEPSGKLRVKCVDVNGRPIPQVMVGTSPNQYMVGGGSTIFCGANSTLNYLRGVRSGLNGHDDLFRAVTDVKGIALIQNLPQGHQSLYAGGKNWKNRQKELGFESKQGEVTEIKVVMDRIE